jgi:hypothetical protein
MLQLNCCRSTAIRLLDAGQLLTQWLLQVKSTTVSVTATGKRLSHLMWQEHTNSFWFRYCCWSNAVSVITAGSTAVSFGVAGQLLLQLLLLVNCCLSYCCMFNSCLNYYRSKYCWRSIYGSVTVPGHPPVSGLLPQIKSFRGFNTRCCFCWRLTRASVGSFSAITVSLSLSVTLAC